MNLIANDTDIDGNADVKNAQIATWPAQLGAQPVPVGGVVTFTPTASGTFSFTYNAVDAAGALSATAATATVTVAAGETIAIGKSNFKASVGGAGNSRWTVDGTDNINQNQTLTIVYNNGTLSAAQGGGACPGLPINPKCVIGTTVVAAGAYLYDKLQAPGGPMDPTDGTAWASKPTSIKVFSSNPVLGGSQTKNIVVR